MMEFLSNLLLAIGSVLSSFTIIDLIDILVISYISYKTIKIVKETKAIQLLKGIILILLLSLLVTTLGLKTTGFLLENIIDIGIIALIILFQPELRKVLEKVGRAKVSTVFTGDGLEKNASSWEIAIPIIVDSVEALSKTTTGALIVIERQNKLGEQIDTGVYMDAYPTRELFGNIFYLKTPLHDGAVIMRDGKILAAACFLPKPQKEELIESHLGSRHRAAIGISEESDAVTVVVSEETGTVSISEAGELNRGFDSKALTEYLRLKLLPVEDEVKKSKAFWKGKKKS